MPVNFGASVSIDGGVRRANYGVGQGGVVGSAASAALTLQDGAVKLDGTNDYLTRGAAFTGAADTNKITAAVAFRWDGSGAEQRLYTDNQSRVIVRLLGTNKLEFLCINTAGATVASLISTSTFNDGAFHVASMSIDCSDATSTNNFAYLYVDDVQEASVGAIAQATIDAVESNHAVGGSIVGSVKFNGCLGAFLYHHGVSLNLTVEANRRKFWNADGTQADWGANGSTPLGVQPLLYLDRKGLTVADYIANKGSGGGMTENGALAIC